MLAGSWRGIKHLRLPIRLYSRPSITHSRASFLLSSPSTMVLPHQTPYVTPHILHKNYAQAFDSEAFGNRMFNFLVSFPRLTIAQSSAATSTTSRRPVSIWIASKSSAMPPSPSSTKTPSATRVPSSRPRAHSSTFPARRLAEAPRTSVSSSRIPARTTSGGVPSTLRWTSVGRLFFYVFSSVKPHTDTFEINRERAIDYLNTRDNVYVFDGYAGVCSPSIYSTNPLISFQWDPKYRIKVRVICARAYHALFMVRHFPIREPFWLMRIFRTTCLSDQPKSNWPTLASPTLSSTMPASSPPTASPRA